LGCLRYLSIRTIFKMANIVTWQERGIVLVFFVYIHFVPNFKFGAKVYIFINVRKTALKRLLTFLYLFFRKPTRPPLPFREGPPLISVFFNSLYDPFGSPCRGQKPQGRRGNRPTRYSNRYAIRLADHQRSAPGFCAGWTAGVCWLLIACWHCSLGTENHSTTAGWRLAETVGCPGGDHIAERDLYVTLKTV